MDLTTATPLEIDTQLADLFRQSAQVDADRKLAVERAHRAVGDRRVRQGRRQVWEMTDEQAMTDARNSTTEEAARAVDAYDNAGERLAEIKREADRLEDEYRRRPWSRFFPVPGGHVHRDMAFRCNRTASTDQRWMPELSGHTEAEAVAALGPALCTVCFPSAPVKWTSAKVGERTDRCAGGTAQGPFQTWGMSRYGKCPTCGSKEIVTMSGSVRAHKPAEAKPEPAAAPAAPVEAPKAPAKPTATDRRYAAIRAIVDAHLVDGEPVGTPDEIAKAIEALATLGRTERWQATVAWWAEAVRGDDLRWALVQGSISAGQAA